MTNNELESIRVEASRAGDFEKSRLANEAMWGETAARRRRALRKLEAMM